MSRDGTDRHSGLTRELARWIAALEPADLPADVLDRVQGLTFHAACSAVLGASLPAGRSIARWIATSERGAEGATILCGGAPATAGGAALANAQLISVGGKWDSFGMLVHPGTSIIPAALAAAEEIGAGGDRTALAIAVGYEVVARLAGDIVPSVAAQGFNANVTFGVIAAAAVAAVLSGLDEDGINAALALSAGMAGGNLENTRQGGRGYPGVAVRDGLAAAHLARLGHAGGDRTLEADAGFYRSFGGILDGRAPFTFSGARAVDLSSAVRGLGESWHMLGTVYRTYSISGYMLGPVELTAGLCREHDIPVDRIADIEVVVNWLETRYPSPAVDGRREDLNTAPRSTAYHVARAAAARGFPVEQGWADKGAADDDADDVRRLAARVAIVPSMSAPLFAPRVTIRTTDGATVRRQATGREFAYDFDEELERMRPLTSVAGAGGIRPAQFDAIAAACKGLGDAPDVRDLVASAVA